jgi:hypothetical protein
MLVVVVAVVSTTLDLEIRLVVLVVKAVVALADLVILVLL